MIAVDNNELYPIGDVARRTGLTVSAIRYYADAGLIAPTGHTSAGYRLYDIPAIVRLELVRSLRELGASLEDIRRLLAEETTLRDLARAHLSLVEGQLRRLQSRRAVLRTIVKQHSTAEQVNLMHKLVSLSDDDRDRIVDEFWNDVTTGIEGSPAVVEQLSQRRPNLPDEPTAEQLEAWIELADLLQDDDFRAEVRQFLHDAFVTGQASRRPGVANEDVERWHAVFAEARAAHEAGVPAHAAGAKDIAHRYVASLAAISGEQDRPRGVAEYDPAGAASRRGARIGSLLGRYLRLVAAINGRARVDPHHARATNEAAFAWLTTAIRTSANDELTTGGSDVG